MSNDLLPIALFVQPGVAPSPSAAFTSLQAFNPSHLYAFAGPLASLKDQATGPNASSSLLTLGDGVTASKMPVATAAAGLAFDGTAQYAGITPAPTYGNACTLYLLVNRYNIRGGANYVYFAAGDLANHQVGIAIQENRSTVYNTDSTQTSTVFDASLDNYTPRTGWMVEAYRYDGTRFHRLIGGDVVQTMNNNGKTLAATTNTTGPVSLWLGALGGVSSGNPAFFSQCQIAGLAVYPGVSHTDAQVKANSVLLVQAAGSVDTNLSVNTNSYLVSARDGADLPAPAMYIGASVYPENQWTQFRTVISYSGTGPYLVGIAQSGDGRLFVNGTQVIGCTGRHTSIAYRPTAVDISPYLTAGTNNNVLVVENYNLGRASPLGQQWMGSSSTLTGVQAGIIVIDYATGAANSGTGWKCKVAAHFAAHGLTAGDSANTGSMVRNNTVQEWHGTVQTLSAIENVHSLAYNATGWASATLPSIASQLLRVVNATLSRQINVLTPSLLLSQGNQTDTGDAAVSAYAPLYAMAREAVATITQVAAGTTATLGGTAASAAGTSSAAGYASYNSGTNSVTLTPGTADTYALLEMPRWSYGAMRLDITVPASCTGVLDVLWFEDLPTSGICRVAVGSGRGGVNCQNVAGTDRVNLSGAAAGTYTVRCGVSGLHGRGGRWCKIILRQGAAPSAVTIKMTLEQWSFVALTPPATWTISDTTMQPYLNYAQGCIFAHMQDTCLDHSMRDNGQWLVDVWLAVRAMRWLTGDNSYARLMQLHCKDTFSLGYTYLPSRVPDYLSGNADWSFGFVNAVSDDYQWTGDTLHVRNMYDSIQRLLNGATFGGTGLIAIAAVYGDFNALGPGTTATTDSTNYLIQNAQMAIALDKASYLASQIGQTTQAQAWATRSALIKATMQTTWRAAAAGGVPAHPVYPVTPGTAGQTTTFSVAGIMLALLAGGIPSADIGPLLAYLCPNGAHTVPANATDWSIWQILQDWPIAAYKNGGVNQFGWLKAMVAPYFSPANQALGYGCMLEVRAATPVPLPNDKGQTSSHSWNGAGIVGFLEGCLGLSIPSPGGNPVFNPVPGLPTLDMTIQGPRGPFRIQKTAATGNANNWTLTGPPSGTVQATISGVTLNAAGGGTAIFSE